MSIERYGVGREIANLEIGYVPHTAYCQWSIGICRNGIDRCLHPLRVEMKTITADEATVIGLCSAKNATYPSGSHEHCLILEKADQLVERRYLTKQYQEEPSFWLIESTALGKDALRCYNFLMQGMVNV